MGFKDKLSNRSDLSDDVPYRRKFREPRTERRREKYSKFFWPVMKKILGTFFLLTKVERQLADKMVQQILAAANKWTEH